MTTEEKIELRTKIINKAYPLFFAFGATKDVNDGSFQRLVGIMEKEFDRYPDLPRVLDQNDNWKYFIIQTAFRNVA